MSTEVRVASLPPCDFCKTLAAFDAKTRLGPWGYLCAQCFEKYGVGLGTGFGQRLVLEEGSE